MGDDELGKKIFLSPLTVNVGEMNQHFRVFTTFCYPRFSLLSFHEGVTLVHFS